MKAHGFDSFESRLRGRADALKFMLGLADDELDKNMDEHQQSRFLTPFVSSTSDIRVACYFATSGCKTDGSIYVLRVSPLARYNPYNTGLLALCHKSTVVSENEWSWLACIDPSFIVDELPVSPKDCC